MRLFLDSWSGLLNAFETVAFDTPSSLATLLSVQTFLSVMFTFYRYFNKKPATIELLIIILLILRYKKRCINIYLVLYVIHHYLRQVQQVI